MTVLNTVSKASYYLRHKPTGLWIRKENLVPWYPSMLVDNFKQAGKFSTVKGANTFKDSLPRLCDKIYNRNNQVILYYESVADKDLKYLQLMAHSILCDRATLDYNTSLKELQDANAKINLATPLIDQIKNNYKTQVEVVKVRSTTTLEEI